MSALWSIFRKDLKAVTAFPRLEILFFIYTFTFLGLSLSSIISLRTPSSITNSDLIKVVDRNFSYYLSSFIYILAPLLVTEVVTGEYERGTLLALVTYPVRRWQILTSKLLAAFLFSSIMIIPTFVCSIVSAFFFNNLAIDFRVVFGYLSSTILLSLFLCSVAVIISVLATRLLVSVVTFVSISICWGIAISGLAMAINSPEIQIYAYSETVRQLAYLILFPDGPFVLFSKQAILIAVAVCGAISFVCLSLSYWLFKRREFK